MSEVKHKAQAVQVEYVCDSCQTGTMTLIPREASSLSSSVIFPSSTQYRHRCGHCGKEQDFPQCYPAVRYERAANVDAGKHAEQCNARAAEERKAKEAEKPRFFVEQTIEAWTVVDGTKPNLRQAYFYGPTPEADARRYADEKNAEAEKPKGPRYVVEEAANGWLYNVLDKCLPSCKSVIAHFYRPEGEQRARDFADFLNSQP